MLPGDLGGTGAAARREFGRLTAWLEKYPQSFEGLRRLGTRLVVEEKWEKAKEVLEQVKAIYPEYVGTG